MTTPTGAESAFPSPFSIETPPGCEGWQELYPYYTLFTEERREIDEGRLWFWNSMHFPMPMPAFDIVSIDGPYYAVGAWQNRAFAVPPAMGVDYRIVNGYVYITVNPVTDPAKIGERAEYFQRRAGHYFANWDDLYARWRTKMENLIAELHAIEVSDLPEYEPEELVFEHDHVSSYVPLLDGYQRTLRLGELMWHHHFEFLLLGYGAYLTFSEFCRGAPARHPRAAHRADDRRDRRAAVPAGCRAAPARARRGRHGARGRVRPGTDTGGDRGGARRQRGRPRLARRPRAGQGSVVQHGDGRRALPLLPQLARRPDDSVRVARRARRGDRRGRRRRAAGRAAARRP